MAPSKPAPDPTETTESSSRDRVPLPEKDENSTVRGFKPQQVENTVISSRNVRPNSPETGDIRALRRWHAQPVETATKSSKDGQKDQKDVQDKKPVRRFAVQPVEESTKSSKEKKPVRKFAVEPVEESTKSSKDRKPARKFAVEPVEQSTKSSKDKKPVRKFAPEIISTDYGSNRRSKSESSSRASSGSDKTPVRKFDVVVLSTATRSRRTGESQAASTDYKTESGFDLHAREHRRHITGVDTSSEDVYQEPDLASLSLQHQGAEHLPPEMARRLCDLDGSTSNSRRPGVSCRQHSYRCPALEVIESSESEPESQGSSQPVSPGAGSPVTASESSFVESYKHATRVRESVDESFTHYLLQIERKKHERRLQEQALAAFANSDFHEPVEHYVNSERDGSDEDDDVYLDDRPTTWEGHDDDEEITRDRRESTAKINWEQIELRKHAEKLEKERASRDATQHQSSPWWNPYSAAAIPDHELQSMQDRARPPMLGLDIKFPRCRSPQPARFDVTQSTATLRSQMCYLTDQSEAERNRAQAGGLWAAPSQPKQDNKRVSVAESPQSKKPRKGLWGGFCAADETPMPGLHVPVQPTGLMTPRPETPRQQKGNPFDQTMLDTPPSRSPPTPSSNIKNTDLGRIDSVLQAERELDELMETEFNDAFVTQVFNFLSLGYPSTARPFDEELGKISRIPIADLRADDKKAKAMPRGYIRLGPDFEGGGGEGVSEDSCARWQALKRYVREWARQEKGMAKSGDFGGNWGMAVRKGSWGL